MRMVWGVVWLFVGSLGGVLGAGGVFDCGFGVRWGVVWGRWLVWGRVRLARRVVRCGGCDVLCLLVWSQQRAAMWS